jgi:hypothetical protein
LPAKYLRKWRNTLQVPLLFDSTAVFSGLCVVNFTIPDLGRLPPCLRASSKYVLACQIDADQLETVIKWMEKGHSVIWGQLLQFRNPVDDLKQCLADGFTVLSKRLEGASDRDNEATGSNDLPNLTLFRRLS